MAKKVESIDYMDVPEKVNGSNSATQGKARFQDDELAAMRRIFAILKDRPIRAQHRIMEYVSDRLDEAQDQRSLPMVEQEGVAD